MATNFVEVVTEAMKAVGVDGTDWRVQAGAAAILIVAGVGMIKEEKVKGWVRKWKAKWKERKQ